MDTPITPTIGRVVWYWPTMQDMAEGMVGGGNQAVPALVCHVWTDTMVNLSIMDANGVQFPKQSVDLIQPGSPIREERGYCEWMPYQIGQAQKAADKVADKDLGPDSP